MCRNLPLFFLKDSKGLAPVSMKLIDVEGK